MIPRLTVLRIQAIRDSLAHSLAGPLEGDRKTYEAALKWANGMIEKRLDPKPMPWCERCQCYHHETARHIR